MTGTPTRSATARVSGMSKPSRVPSRSMLVSKISPAPASAMRAHHATASMPVGLRPPWVNTSQRGALGGAHRDGIPGVAQLLEAHAFLDAASVDVQAGDDPLAQHQRLAGSVAAPPVAAAAALVAWAARASASSTVNTPS